MKSREPIRKLLNQLEVNRLKLQYLLRQSEQLTAEGPLSIESDIQATRNNILRIKDDLEKLGVVFEEHPNDIELSSYEPILSDSRDTSSRYDTAKLRERIIASFSLHELKTEIIFDHFHSTLYADIEGITSSREVAQHLIAYCKQRQYFPKLIKLLKEQRPRVFSDEVDEEESLRQLEQGLLARKKKLTEEIDNTARYIDDIQLQTAGLHLQRKELQQRIDNLMVDDNTPAIKVLPFYEGLSQISLRIDSLVATREEFKRVARRAQQGISEVDAQLVVIRKLRGTPENR